MKHKRFLVTALLVMLPLSVLLTTTWAQTAQFQIDRWIFSGGVSGNNTYTLTGVVGQTEAGTQMTGATFQVEGGFVFLANRVAPQLYLPLVLQQPSPTPAPPPIVTPIVTAIVTPPVQMSWQRVGAGGMELSALAQEGDKLFAADRRLFAQGGGLYWRSLAGCNLTTGWTRLETIPLSVLDIEFQGDLGIIAAFARNGVFYTRDGGATWTRTSELPGQPRTVAIAQNNVFLVGTENDGLFKSADAGVRWSQQSATPQFVTTLVVNANIIWIGADQADNGSTQNAGVWKLDTVDGRPTPINGGLSEGNSRRVWDFLFGANNQIYLATSNGVFRGDGLTNWTPFDLQGTQLRSLESNQGYLYAGAFDEGNQGTQAGVRRRALAGGNWEQIASPSWDTTYTVRDLLYETTYCQGLLAATDDGAWLYR